MKTVVIYKSKTGFTKTYAEWIAEELQCDLKENNKLALSDIENYDCIIYGGGMYAGGIYGWELIKDNLQALADKKLVLWATGCNPGRKENMDAVWKNQIPEEYFDQVHPFYLRGGFDYNKLGKVDKVLMKMLKVKLKNDKNPSSDTIGMLNAYDVPEDHRKKENIKELIDCVRAF
jgi:menaquinone-dependent protoporphyrinogen IX oxidase